MSKEKLIQLTLTLVIISVFGFAGYFGYMEVKKAISDNGKSAGQTSPASAPLSTGRQADDQVYTHPDYGFTLRYPGDLKLGKFPEGEGEVILLQSSNAQQGFQIFIAPYAEKENFSKEVILKSDPKMNIENDKNIDLGTEGLAALSFDSGNDSSPTHELWFVADGNLYQCTSFSDYGAEMEKVMGSITFN